MSAHEPGDVLDTPEAGGLVVRGGAIRVAGFVVGLLASLGGVALVTRHLGPGLYGRFQTVVSLIMVVGALTDLGMTTLGVREYVQRSGAERERLMRTLLGMRIVLTLVGIAVATLIVAVGRDWGWQVVAGAALMGVGLLFTVLQTTLAIPLNAELRLGTVTAIDVVRQVLTAACFAALVAAGAGILPFLAVTVPVHAALVVWTARLVRGRVPLRPTFELDAWGGLLRTSVAFALATAVGVTYQYIAQILTAFVADEDAAGYFAASFRVFIIAAAVPGLLVTSAFPLLSRSAQTHAERFANVVRGLFEGTVILGAAAAITCVLGATTIIDVVNGDDFAPAADALRIQGAVLLLTFVTSGLGLALLALHRHRELVVANVAALVTTAVVVIVLAREYDEEGAAIGTVVGESVLAAGCLIGLLRARPELRPPAAAARSLAAAAVGLGAGLLLDAGAVPDTVLALVVYGAGLVLLRAIPEDLLALLPDGVRRRLPGRTP